MQSGNVDQASWGDDLSEPKRIVLIAHDDRKRDLLEWAEYNRDIPADHTLNATGTAGRLPSARLDLPVTCFHSGPLGGDHPPVSPASFTVR